MEEDTQKYISSCDKCQKNKHRNEKKKGLLEPLPIPPSKWSWISTDAVTHLPKTKNGFDCIQGYTDMLTKQVHLAARKDSDTTEDAIKLLWQEVIRHHGCPEVIVSDRDHLFTSSKWKEFCKEAGIETRMSTSYHAQTDGQSERTNRTFTQILRMFVNYFQNDWDEHLPMIEFAMNNASSATTRHSPFFLNFGKHPRQPGTITTPANREQQSFEAMEKTMEKVRECIKIAKEQQAKYYNRSVQDQHFNVNDLVLLDATHLKLPIEKKQNCRKLMQLHIGPFKILERIGSSAYRLELPKHLSRVHPVFNVALLYKYKDPQQHFPDRPIDSRPDPTLIDSNFEYEVQEILDRRKYRNGTQYLVQWSGYPKEDATWEPAKNLKNCQEMINEFHRKNPTRK
jgi:transposase InsO family protein